MSKKNINDLDLSNIYPLLDTITETQKETFHKILEGEGNCIGYWCNKDSCIMCISASRCYVSKAMEDKDYTDLGINEFTYILHKKFKTYIVLKEC
jgi:hypothetical protein